MSVYVIYLMQFVLFGPLTIPRAKNTTKFAVGATGLPSPNTIFHLTARAKFSQGLTIIYCLVSSAKRFWLSWEFNMAENFQNNAIAV